MKRLCPLRKSARPLKTGAGLTEITIFWSDYVKKFFDEAAYQLCDGFAVNTGYFSIHPNISGSLENATETYDRSKNPVNFKFRVGARLRNLAKYIDVVIAGIADCNAFIGDFVDNYENAKNTLFVPGSIFTIYGNKIKIAGEDHETGVFFVPVDDPSKAVKVERIIENFPGKIIGEAPKTKHRLNRIEIRTRYAGSKSTLLKAPRIIKSSFVLETA